MTVRGLLEIEASNKGFVWLMTVMTVIDFLLFIASLQIFQNQSFSIILILSAITVDIVILILLLFRFTYTHAFQAGLWSLMFNDLKLEIFIGVLYTICTIGYRGSLMITFFGNPVLNGYSFPNGPQDQVALAIYRIMGAIYYFYMQRAALKLCDLKYYYDSQWFQSKSSKFVKS